MKTTYPYSNDTEFLKKIDTQKIHSQYVKLILLDWEEKPLEDIQGYATGGSLNITGDSSQRQTCTLSMYIPKENYNVTNINNLISINKKIYLEIGVENQQEEYQEHKTIWFPQGLFCIVGCSLTYDAGGVALSLQLRDKISLLDGTCGGIIPAATQLDRYDTIDENGEWVTKKPIIEQIIRELVHHFGGEQLGKIIINDIPSRIKAAMRWMGDTPLYKYYTGAGGDGSAGSYGMTTELAVAEQYSSYNTFEYGEDVGFIYTDFVYPTELIINAGTSITAALDQIKETLGANYEYFYDKDGNFIFREKQNYLNTTQATVDLDEINNDNYLVDMTGGKSVYNLSDSPLVVSFSNSPQYGHIKNDFVVWGKRTNGEGLTLPIRYHLAIDKKPETGNLYSVYFYNDPEDGLEKAKVPASFNSLSDFPLIGIAGALYLDKDQQAIYTWDGQTKSYKTISGQVFTTYVPNIDGETGIVYIDKNTQERFCWGIDTTSELYLDKEREKDLAYQAYLNSASPFEQSIQINKDLIKDAKAQLKFINMSTEEVDLKISKIEEEIQTRTDNGSELESERTTKQTAYDNETDLHQKERLEKEISILQQQIGANQIAIEELIVEREVLLSYLQIIPDLEGLIIEKTDENTQMQILIENDFSEYKEIVEQLTKESYQYLPIPTIEISKVKATDWRSELYLQGAQAELLGLESNPYYIELATEWPKLYNLRDHLEKGVYVGAFRPEFLERPWEIDYFLDFIDSTESISQFGVSNIGRRTIVESKDSYNCVFEPEIPDFVLIESGRPETEMNRLECQRRGQAFIQVPSSIYTTLAMGGRQNGCFTQIKDLLYYHTQYNEAIQIQMVPIFHLEVNNRITARNLETNIYGDYVLKSLSIPLTVGGNMSLSAVRATNKL